MKQFAIAALFWSVLAGQISADMVLYNIPYANAQILLQGRIKTNPGGTSTFTHPKYGNFYMATHNVLEVYKVPSEKAIYDRMLNQANTAEDALKAADYALKHGNTAGVYKAAAAAIKFDSNNERARKIESLYRLIREPLGDHSKEEAELRKVVRTSGMKIKTSPHFILLHDTPDKKPTFGEKQMRYTRAESRLQLLERVYETFLLKFYSKGVTLEIPKERLKVVLFNDNSDYYDFANTISPSLSSTIGFWDPDTNISFFFDHGSSDQFKMLGAIADDLQRQKAEAKRIRALNAREIVRMADTISLLVAVDQENSDIEVVSHECTHQMAGNTGLFPRHVRIPQWVHEGMATYFEAPADASWSGIGAVNKDRLAYYRALAEGDREHSNIDFVVGDQIFKYAATHGAVLHGYAQAWALTHFLVEKHFDEFMAFSRRLGQMPPDIILSPGTLTKLFDDTFTTERETMNLEWRRYMKSLRTDTETILEGKKQSGFR